MSRPPKCARLGLDSEPAPRVELPHLALKIIAGYLSPHELLQAAGVSRSWHDVFTSDAAWTQYNVYGVESGIHRHYLETSKIANIEECTCGGYHLSSGAYLYQVLARRRDTVQLPLSVSLTLQAPIEFFRLLSSAKINAHMTFEGVPTRFQDDKPLVYSLLRAGVGPYGLSPAFKEDCNAALSTTWKSCLKFCEEGDFFGGGNRWRFSRAILKNRDVAIRAVKVYGCNYHLLDEDFRADKKIFKLFLKRYCARGWQYMDEAHVPLLVEAIPASLVASRDSILQLFSNYKLPQPLHFIPDELQEDWEVVSAALQYGPTGKCLDTPLPFPHMPVATSILKDRDHVLALLKYGWLLPLEHMPKELRLNKQVLQHVAEIIGKCRVMQGDLTAGWFRRRGGAQLRRLAAIYPFDVETDYDLVVQTITLPPTVARELDAMPTKYELKQALFQFLGVEYRIHPMECPRHHMMNCCRRICGRGAPKPLRGGSTAK